MSLDERFEVSEYKMKTEPRGWFQKPLTGNDNIPDRFGEIYAVQAHPGEVRGNHYHEKASEWFCVLDGVATVYLSDVDTGEQHSLTLSSDNAQRLLIRPRVGHVFVNEGDHPFILIAYTDELFDPADTIPMKVRSEQ